MYIHIHICIHTCIIGWPKQANKHTLFVVIFVANIQNLASLFIVITYNHLRLSFECNSLNMTKKTNVSFNQRDPGSHHFTFKFSGVCDLVVYTT